MKLSREKQYCGYDVFQKAKMNMLHSHERLGLLCVVINTSDGCVG